MEKNWKNLIEGFVFLVIAYILYILLREYFLNDPLFSWFIWFFENIPYFLGIAFIVVIIIYAFEKVSIMFKKEEHRNHSSSNSKSHVNKSRIVVLAVAVILFLAIVVPIYFYVVMPAIQVATKTLSPDFKVSNATYHERYHVTGIDLTYVGDKDVNVSVYWEFYFDGDKINQTRNYGVMKKGDWYGIGFHGYVTWLEVIYNGHRTRITFTPSRIKE